MYIYRFTSASQRPFCSLCEFLLWVRRLATFAAGVQREEVRAGIVWHNECRLANKVTYVCGAADFSQSASTLHSGDTGLTSNFGNVWLNEYKITLSTQLFRKYQGSGQDVNVCDVAEQQVTRRQHKGMLSVTSIWHIFPVVSAPSPRYSLWWRKITRSAG